MEMAQLEKMLEEARQEIIQSQTNNQELHNELTRLKSKVNDLQHKL